MSNLALNASGICHRYGKQQALLDITFSLPKGTRCGLIGPDGAGKSSLLGLIAGVKKLQQGSLEVLVTGDTEAFKSSGLRLLGRGLDDVKHLDLEDLISE